MKIAVGSVLYPAAEKYLEEFFESLDRQTYGIFDFLLLNDGVIKNRVMDYYFCKWAGRLELADFSGKGYAPYQLRIELLKRAKALGYELLILCDCDDKYPVNRVERIVEECSDDYSFYYNEIRSFSGNTLFPKLPEVTDSVEKILEENYLGLSNTALMLRKLSNSFLDSLQEGNTKIFDWYLFSRILLDGGVGRMVADTCSYYRLHENNVAGICPEIKKELEIKIRHYELLAGHDCRYKELVDLYKQANILDEKEQEPTEAQFWWSCIKLYTNKKSFKKE